MDFQFPHDVEGWLSPEEGAALAQYAQGGRVLEIGCYLGRSTVCLAQTARSVLSVDPFDGRATTAPRDTLEHYKQNLDNHRRQAEVEWLRGTSADVLPTLSDDPGFDLIFIDGDHAYETVRHDVAQARRLLARGGLIALHDYRKSPGEYDGHWDPGVTRAADELIDVGAKVVCRVGSLLILDPAQAGEPTTRPGPPSNEPLVAIVQPRGGSAVRCADSADAFYRPTNKGVARIPLRKSTSLAIRCFNLLLCDALNARREYPVTHLAMLHDDVCPEPGWLDVMLDELEASGADFLSAVVPIKNGAGLTSTAVDMVGAPWVVRRLSMKEVFDLPETFTLADIPWVGAERLLVNTGLWITRLDTWAERIFPRDNATGKSRQADLFFTDRARIIQAPDGEYLAEDISEDWDFSRQLDALGVTVAATRKVPLYHERPEFTSSNVWGAWQTDLGYLACLKRLGLLQPEPQLAEV